MIGDLIVELVGGAVRLLVGALGEIAAELLIKGPGYLICRAFTRNVDPDGGAVILSGLLVWVALGIAAWAIVRHLHHAVGSVSLCSD